MRGHFMIDRIDWPRLICGVLVTAVCALSVHVVMLQIMAVPFPDLSAIPPAFKFPIRAMATLGLIIFCQLSSQTLQGSLAKQSAALFLFSSMLTETLLRGPFMDAYCTTAWTFIFVANGQKVLTMALASLMIVSATPKLPLVWQKVAGAIVITGLTSFVVGPLIDKAMGPVMAAIAHLAPQSEWCALPYGASVLIPAYLTFLEPVLASVAGAALVWDRLSPVRGLRFVQFTVLILAIKNQLVTPFVYAVLSKTPFLSALMSDGQFALEAVALAVLTGMTWEWSTDESSMRAQPASSTASTD
jgi:hypothetical protein